jgi:hypothetical protein
MIFRIVDPPCDDCLCQQLARTKGGDGKWKEKKEPV